MFNVPVWLRPLFMSETPKNPWGGGGGNAGGGGDNGKDGGGKDGGGKGGGGQDDGGGPRNPWAPPPSGPRPRSSRPTALDEFLRRARPGGGGGGGPLGGGGSGFRFPFGQSARSLWLLGVGVLIALWIIFTSIHVIGPQQRGVVTLFGRYSGILQPGVMNFTLPAPIAAVRVVNVTSIRSFDVPVNGGANLMLTRDQNIVDVDYSVRWVVSDPERYAFQLANPDDTVQAVAESAMRSEIANATLDEAIGNGRTAIEGRVTEAIQRVLDSYRAGIQIRGVSIKGALPPDKVVEAFKDVSAANSDAQALINNARGYEQQVIANAQGEAAQFNKLFTQYKLAPEVTRRRLYYETMEAVLARNNKVIVEPKNIAPFLPIPSGNATRAPDPTATPAPQPQNGGQ